MKNKIKRLLLKLGVDPSLHGYDYLVDAIDICYQDKSYARQITKRLYPYVASKNNTTVDRAERCIRNAVEKVCNTASDLVDELILPISCDSGKYTNSQFICACVEKLKMEEENA